MNDLYKNANLVFYTNCQGGIGINTLLSSKFIFKSINYIETFSTIWNNKELPINILNNADIFIYQPINVKYGKYSTDITISNNILTHLNKNCIQISFPYIYFACLYPLYSNHPAAEIDGGNLYDISKVVNRDVIINLKNIIKETYKHTFEYINQEIIKLYDNQLIDFKFEENYKNTIERIQNSEKNCNIKITHLFTLENIKNIKLMHSNNHPTNYILKYLTNQVLKILNLPLNNFDEINNEILSGFSYSIYSYNYYKFNWLNPKDCNEDFYKELVLLVLNNC